MKRYMIALCCLLIGLTALAKPLKLNVEKFFDGSYNTNKNVSIHISKSKSKYYRGFTVQNDAALVDKVTAMFRKDEAVAESSQEFITSGTLTFINSTFINNGEKITVGLSFSSPNSCYLFITGTERAFE